MRRVFFLTYYFPPLGGVAALRALKFAKYLPEFGWEPVVFHAGSGNLYLQDPSLLEEVPKGLRRIPVRTFENAALLNGLNRLGLRFVSYRIPRLYPIDGQVGWLPALVRALQRETAQGRPDALFSSAPPYSATLAGLHMKRRYDVPWVADFRDEWTQNELARYLTPLHRLAARRSELAVLAAADAVTTVTGKMAARFQQDRPPERRPVEVIGNGYDEADFDDVAESAALNDKWTLGVIGSVYPGNEPATILTALAKLTQQGVVNPAHVRVLHVGNGTLRAPAGAAFEVKSLGFQPHRAAIKQMVQCDALLLEMSESAGVRASARIYEYFRSGRPIVCVSPPGEAGDLIAQIRAGRSFAPPAADLPGYLTELYVAWKRGERTVGASPEAAQPYSRREEARRLAGVLDAISA